MLQLRQNSLVVLAGPSGVGKSTWAEKHFKETEIVSSDRMRELITDDANNQTVNAEAFNLVHLLASERLKAGRSAVLDSTALVSKDRKKLLEISRKHKAFTTLIVFLGDENLCMRGQKSRDRAVPQHIVEKHIARLQNIISLGEKGLKEEGFDEVIFFDRKQADKVEKVEWISNTLRDVDIIGDVHGCVVELQMLLTDLGYDTDDKGVWKHPEGRVAVFVGDFTDRGPNSLAVLRLVLDMKRQGSGIIAALGNHDWKLYRHTALERNVKPSNGLNTTLREIESEVEAGTLNRKQIVRILHELFGDAPSCTVLDSGQLIITHGAVKRGQENIPTDKQRRSAHAALCLFGETTGNTDEQGHPERIYDWAETWKNTQSTVVFGHDVVGGQPRWINDNVVGIDTGCVFGGKLTAMRWPSKKIVQVDALRTYAEH